MNSLKEQKSYKRTYKAAQPGVRHKSKETRRNSIEGLQHRGRDR